MVVCEGSSVFVSLAVLPALAGLSLAVFLGPMMGLRKAAAYALFVGFFFFLLFARITTDSPAVTLYRCEPLFRGIVFGGVLGPICLLTWHRFNNLALLCGVALLGVFAIRTLYFLLPVNSVFWWGIAMGAGLLAFGTLHRRRARARR